jgi:hypothetical protein
MDQILSSLSQNLYFLPEPHILIPVKYNIKILQNYLQQYNNILSGYMTDH